MSLVFVVAAFVAVSGAAGVVLAKSPVHSVLALVLNFIALAVLFLSLQAEFMAVIQLIIYAGAVMILFLFVIALLTARKELPASPNRWLKNQEVLGAAAGLGLMAVLGTVALAGDGATAEVPADFGTVMAFGRSLLTTNVFVFELTAFVLLVAVIGVVILVGRHEA